MRALTRLSRREGGDDHVFVVRFVVPTSPSSACVGRMMPASAVRLWLLSYAPPRIDVHLLEVFHPPFIGGKAKVGSEGVHQYTLAHALDLFREVHAQVVEGFLGQLLREEASDAFRRWRNCAMRLVQ